MLGDAANLASRLPDAAERGEIFVGAETVRLTREQFEFVERGAMPFKGKSAPQWVHQLAGARQTGRTHRPVHTLTPLFGRTGELESLQRVTRKSETQARPRVISILGDAGLGKSRLVQEWRAAQNKADSFFVAGGAPDGNGRAYGLLTEITRVLLPGQNDGAQISLLALLGGADAHGHAHGEMDAACPTHCKGF